MSQIQHLGEEARKALNKQQQLRASQTKPPQQQAKNATNYVGLGAEALILGKSLNIEPSKDQQRSPQQKGFPGMDGKFALRSDWQPTQAQKKAVEHTQ